MTYKEQLLTIGVSPKAATRRSNVLDKQKTVVRNAFVWGVKTFGSYAPTKVSELNKAPENLTIFKQIAYLARKHGYNSHA